VDRTDGISSSCGRAEVIGFSCIWGVSAYALGISIACIGGAVAIGLRRSGARFSHKSSRGTLALQ